MTARGEGMGGVRGSVPCGGVELDRPGLRRGGDGRVPVARAGAPLRLTRGRICGTANQLGIS